MLSRRSRMVAPFVVAGLIAAGAVAPTLEAAASPHLPGISPQALVEKVLNEKVSHLSGTFQWKAALGLPSLSGLASGGGQSVSTSSGFDPTSLLSGQHAFKVWVDGAGRQRIAAPATLAETDIVHRGQQAWLYDSSTDHVTHYVFKGSAASGGAAASQPLDGVTVTAVAAEVLRSVRSVGTTVSVGQPVSVAGRAAYVLRLAPNRTIAANRASTVSAVTIAVDAKTGLPLRVAVYAVGESGPALQVGYSSISYGTPSASIFAVPKGQTTTTKVINAPTGLAEHRTAAHPAGPAPAKAAPAQAAPAKAVAAKAAAAKAAPAQDWGTIANLSSGALTGSHGGELSTVTTVVSGSWGSGRLLTSTLVNALFLDNGRVLVGLVTPHALEAAAGQLHH